MKRSSEAAHISSPNESRSPKHLIVEGTAGTKGKKRQKCSSSSPSDRTVTSQMTRRPLSIQTRGHIARLRSQSGSERSNSHDTHNHQEGSSRNGCPPRPETTTCTRAPLATSNDEDGATHQTTTTNAEASSSSSPISSRKRRRSMKRSIIRVSVENTIAEEATNGNQASAEEEKEEDSGRGGAERPKRGKRKGR
jgi:hypothetical protein